MMLRFIFIGIATSVALFVVNQLIKSFQQKTVDTEWNEDEPIEIQEKKVIKLALKSGGKITLPEICTHTNLSVDQAQVVLNGLQEKQVVNIQMTNSGSKVYALSDLADDNDKREAIDLV